jgi:uncharacterized protein
MNAHPLRMTWVDLAFLHWPVPVNTLRPLVPASLEIETFEGSAWVAVTPFEMRNVRALGMLPVPTATDFPELNVRTYVQHGGRSAVWFFSLDAASWLAVAGARATTGLPYFHARMRARRTGEDLTYRSERTQAGARPAVFHGRYRPTGDVYRSAPGSFDHWCTERYSLFSILAGRLLRLDIEHAPWPLQPAAAEIEVNTMAQASLIDLPRTAPHVLFAQRLDVLAHWPTTA